VPNLQIVIDISMKYDLYPYDPTKKQKSWCFDKFLAKKWLKYAKIGQHLAIFPI